MQPFFYPLGGDFELNYDTILESAGVYETMRANLNEPLKSKEDLDELIFGT